MPTHFLSTSELARILGISRVAVFQKIKLGQIKAKKVGRNYVIDAEDVLGLVGDELTEANKQAIKEAVRKIIADYGETLHLLGKE